MGLENMVIPAHVAVILDGNGRWAKKRGIPRAMGHKAGCETLETMVEAAARMGIGYFTVVARFSRHRRIRCGLTDFNWQSGCRP